MGKGDINNSLNCRPYSLTVHTENGVYPFLIHAILPFGISITFLGDIPIGPARLRLPENTFIFLPVKKAGAFRLLLFLFLIMNY